MLYVACIIVMIKSITMSDYATEVGSRRKRI